MAKPKSRSNRSKRNSRLSWFKKFRLNRRSQLALFAVIFAVIGGTILYRSFAAINSTSVSQDDYFGISRGGLQWLNDGERQAKLDDMKSMGVKWLRIDIMWSDVQDSGPNSYNWGAYDTLVNQINDRDIKILADITYAPRWALPTDIPVALTAANKSIWEHYAPNNAQDYADFAKKVAEHYNGSIDYFEIWNEANNDDFFKPKPDAGKYTAMLRRSYTGIKSVNSNAVVISSGLAPYGEVGQVSAGGGKVNPVTFLERLYKAGIKGYFDALGWHPYNWGSGSPSQKVGWNAWYQMHSTSPSALSVMKANGEAGKKIWMTEWGYPSLKVAPSISDKVLQKQYLLEGYKLAKGYSWSGPLFWFTYDDGSTGGGAIFDSFGLVNRDGTHKRAYAAYKSAAKKSKKY